ncbi:hypothetical protein SDRG_14745 [Saprolegnia diclina VS20]|uniref:Ubiquitin-like domain-containing protein n=1 Tax=Saprolegnia diclina (strain VS20) TaxID=1156394 RepID=T0PPP4_SAPDV|nr:hypothetical protein SDRG_14745 [Saprolegnia diclina VS20]EQC27419.1 hypothetical protein SDRG_14745 [Saprolegnia diclina VS20]|eukprot:XP_008619119.1 hypothetical protein SDRG_14745 [Saprolegnia diclina VS20]
MPKKKAKKHAAASSEDGTPEAHPDAEYVPLAIPEETVELVTLDMRLLNWSYLNFKWKVKTSTRLFAVKNEIEKRHGPITSLKICKDHFAEANELTDEMLTLHEYGIDGAPAFEKEVVCLIYYDFKPTQHDNPLLLATEQY